MPDKQTLEMIGKATGLAALLFTAFSYVYDLHLSQRAARYDASLALIQRYRADEIRRSETLLAQRLLYYQSDGLDPNDPDDYSDRLFDGMAREILFGDTGGDAPEKPFLGRLFLIADFYAEVAFCIRGSMCDSDVAIAYFCPRAKALRENNRRLLDYYSAYAGSEEWSHGLETLVEICSA